MGTACDDGNACTLGDKCTAARRMYRHTEVMQRQQRVHGDSCQPSTGTCTNTGGTCGITLLSACTMTDAANRVTAVFGYESSSSGTANIEVAHGPDNLLTPAELQGRQPRWFKPGTQEAALALPIPPGATVSWKLGAQTVSATSTTPPCTGAQATAANEQHFLSGPGNALLPLQAPVAMGTLPGDLDVTHTGDASYSIPLHTPAGRLGIEPNLSLVYNSGSNRNGLLGVGWGISGLPTIHRCAKTIAQDGEASPIQFTYLDAFCLDGERLVQVDTGTPAQGEQTAWAEYRTERDSYSRIRAFVGAGGGPQYFTVRTSDGRTLTFGFSGAASDTYAQVATITPNMTSPDPEEPSYTQTGVIYDWPLTTVEDRFGNAMTITYSTNPGAAPDFAFERLPERITYTHDAAGARGHRRVEFHYEERSTKVATDPTVVSFAGGVRHEIKKLLTSVRMFAPNPTPPSATGGTPVRSYKLEYEASPSTGRALLAQVSECDGSGVGTACKPASSFDYTVGSASFSPRKLTGITAAELTSTDFYLYGLSENARLAIGDLNNDGLDDIAYRFYGGGGTTATYVRLRDDLQPTGFSGLIPVSVEGAHIGTPMVADINGDGKGELGFYNYTAGPPAVSEHLSFCTLTFTGQSASCALNPQSESHEAQNIPGLESLFTLPADLSGDGLPELIRTMGLPDLLHVRRNQAAALQAYSPFILEERSSPLFDDIRAEDIDGDGRQEVLLWATENDRKYSFRRLPPSGTATGGSTNIVIRSFPENRFVDVNGDGLRDIVNIDVLPTNVGGITSYRKHLVVQINTGNGFLKPVSLFSDVDVPGNFPAPMYSYKTGASINTQRDDDGLRVLDWDGDGRDDLLMVDRLSGGTLNPRPSVSVIRFRPDGQAEIIPTGIPVGTPANGPAGVNVGSCPITCNRNRNPGDPPCEFDSSCLVEPAQEAEPMGYHLSQTIDYNGDGLSNLIQFDSEPGINQLVVYVRQGGKADMLSNVTNGLGAQSRVAYRHIGDKTARVPVPDPAVDPTINDHLSALYAAPPSCESDFFACPKSGQWVVSDVTRDNGAAPATWPRTFYSYEDARYSRKGWGFLGFGERLEETTRLQNGERISTSRQVIYASFEDENQFFPFVGLPREMHTIVQRTGAMGVGAKHTTSKWFSRTYTGRNASGAVVSTGVKYYDVFQREESTVRSEQPLPDVPETGGTLQSISEVFVPTAEFGRVQSYTRTVSGATFSPSHRDTVNVVTFSADDKTNWLIGRPTRVATTSGTGAQAVTRTVDYTYNPTNQFLTGIVHEPGDPAIADQRLTTTFTPDDTGQVVRVTEGNTTGKTREAYFTYDPAEGIYRQSASNKLGLTTTTVHHPAVDQVALTRDANGVVTRFAYDTFGRMLKTQTPEGVADVNVTYSANATSTFVETKVDGSGPARVEYDRVGRAIRRRTEGAAGVSVSTISYDVVGRPLTVSRPHPENTTPPPASLTSLEHDELGRVTRITGATEAGAIATLRRFVYAGHTTTAFEAQQVSPLKESRRVLERDYRGLLVRSIEDVVIDGVSKHVTAEYGWGSLGLLENVNIKRDSGDTAAVLTTAMTYDRLGRRTQVNDSNRGQRTTTYNAFGEMATHTDPLNQTTSYFYDDAGRMIQRIAPEGTSIWEHDSALSGLGRLHRATSPDGVVQEHSYNLLGRPKLHRTTVAGQMFEFENVYDPMLGRLDKLIYPQTPGWPRFEAKTGYRDMTGELVSLTRTDSSTELWRAQTFDIEGRVTNEKLGNSIDANFTFNPLTGRLTSIESDNPGTGAVVERLSYRYYDNGNVRSRSDTRDAMNSLHEHFTYDELDRLTTWQAGTTQGDPLPGSWKVDYKFDETGNMLSRTTSTAAGQTQLATYGHGDRPNAGASAVTSWMIGSVSGVFDYDLSRRIIQHPRLGQIDYNSFDLPTRITGAVDASFGYDAGGTRAFKDEDPGNGKRSITLYAGGLYEMRILTGGQTQTEHVLHLAAGGRSIGQITRSVSVTGVLGEKSSFHSTDHLASVRAVVDSTGQVQRKVMDPFGNAMANSLNPVLDTASLLMTPLEGRTSAGFTGHEHDDVLGVINMRGRIYEPLAQRFLSPDPFVGSPGEPQAWNAYSYVMNSPLAYVDPTGFIPEGPGGWRPPARVVLHGFAAALQACADKPGGCMADSLGLPFLTSGEISGAGGSVDPLSRERALTAQILRDEIPGLKQSEALKMAVDITAATERMEMNVAIKEGCAGATVDGSCTGNVWAYFNSGDVHVYTKDMTDTLLSVSVRTAERILGAWARFQAWDPLGWNEAIEASWAELEEKHGIKIPRYEPAVGGTVKVVGNLAKGARGAAAVAKHHAWPKYLGGAAKQELVPLSRKLHDAFHSGLDKILPRQWTTKYYQNLGPAAKAEVLRDLATYTRAFDAKHGTNIFDALVKAGFPGQ